MEKIYKQIAGNEVVRMGIIDHDERVFGMTISTSAKDRDGDVVVQSGWVLDRYMDNPIVLWLHDYRHPIGTVTHIEPATNHLRAEIKLASGTSLTDEIWALVEQGVIRAASVGFLPLRWEPIDGGRKYTSAELVEVSLVSVPANPEAIMSLAKGYGLEVVERKGATTFLDLPLDAEASWDADAARDRIAKWASSDGSGDKEKIDWTKYRRAFAWYDADNPELFSSYKLPYADVRDGSLRAIWRGVVAVMGAILGARGGVNIPDTDRRKVYDHMARYYRKADKEPPQFRELSEIISEMYVRIAILEEKIGIAKPGPVKVPVIMSGKGG